LECRPPWERLWPALRMIIQSDRSSHCLRLPEKSVFWKLIAQMGILLEFSLNLSKDPLNGLWNLLRRLICDPFGCLRKGGSRDRMAEKPDPGSDFQIEAHLPCFRLPGTGFGDIQMQTRSSQLESWIPRLGHVFADIQASVIISSLFVEKYSKRIWADAFHSENEWGRIGFRLRILRNNWSTSECAFWSVSFNSLLPLQII
jgi:hypothetical protein